MKRDEALMTLNEVIENHHATIFGCSFDREQTENYVEGVTWFLDLFEEMGFVECEPLSDQPHFLDRTDQFRKMNIDDMTPTECAAAVHELTQNAYGFYDMWLRHYGRAAGKVYTRTDAVNFIRKSPLYVTLLSKLTS